MNHNDPTRPILLVEDNPMDVDLTVRAFKKRNIANPIQIARDGEQALAWWPHWEAGEPLPAVILPKVHGLEVLRQIKAHSQFAAIPIVVLTSSSEDRDIKAAYQLGVNSSSSSRWISTNSWKLPRRSSYIGSC
jgi:CheY-like chemotaxis protein